MTSDSGSTPVLLSLALLAGVALLGACHAPRAARPTWTTGTLPSADGVPIAYQTAGQGPVTVVFVHGWLGDRSSWRHQLDHFAATHRVVALDLAGHGASGLGRERWTYRAFGADVAAVVRGLELDRVVLVGHSMGGPVALEAARLAPGEVIGIVGVDTLHDPEAPGPSEQAVDAFVAPFRERFADAVRTLVAGAMFAPDTDAELKAGIVEDMASSDPVAGVGALRANMEWASSTRAEALAELRVPVHLINTDLYPSEADAIARHGMQLSLLPGLGHFPMLEDPAAFNARLSLALAELARDRQRAPRLEP